MEKGAGFAKHLSQEDMSCSLGLRWQSPQATCAIKQGSDRMTIWGMAKLAICLIRCMLHLQILSEVINGMLYFHANFAKSCAMSLEHSR